MLISYIRFTIFAHGSQRVFIATDCYDRSRMKGRVSVYIKTAYVDNEVGLHARPATFFIQKANEFKSTIWIEKDERRVNAKSLLGVLSLGIMKGTEITIIGDGPDETIAVDTLADLVAANFAE